MESLNGDLDNIVGCTVISTGKMEQQCKPQNKRKHRKNYGKAHTFKKVDSGATKNLVNNDEEDMNEQKTNKLMKTLENVLHEIIEKESINITYFDDDELIERAKKLSHDIHGYESYGTLINRKWAKRFKLKFTEKAKSSAEKERIPAEKHAKENDKMKELHEKRDAWLTAYKRQYNKPPADLQIDFLNDLNNKMNEWKLNVDQVYSVGVYYLPRVKRSENTKDYFTILACSNRSGKHKMRILISENPEGAKGHIPKHVFLRWFHTEFVPEVINVTPIDLDRIQPKKALLLLQDSHNFTIGEQLISADGSIEAMCLPEDCIHPMKYVFPILKIDYKMELLLILATTRKSIDAIEDVAMILYDVWNRITALDIQLSWKRLYYDAETDPTSTILETKIERLQSDLARLVILHMPKLTVDQIAHCFTADDKPIEVIKNEPEEIDEADEFQSGLDQHNASQNTPHQQTESSAKELHDVKLNVNVSTQIAESKQCDVDVQVNDVPSSITLGQSSVNLTLKAVKAGLSCFPQDEIKNKKTTLSWLKENKENKATAPSTAGTPAKDNYTLVSPQEALISVNTCILWAKDNNIRESIVKSLIILQEDIRLKILKECIAHKITLNK